MKKTANRLIAQIVFVLFCLVVLPLPASAVKMCPKCGARFSDEYKHCDKDGTLLSGQGKKLQKPGAKKTETTTTGRKPSSGQASKQKVYVLTQNGKTEEMKFNGFNTDCEGYGKEGIAYTEQGIRIIIPWKDVSYIIPEYAVGKLKNGRSFSSNSLNPSSCYDAKIKANRTKTVDVLGYNKQVTEEVTLELNDMGVIAFSPAGLEEGGREKAEKKLAEEKRKAEEARLAEEKRKAEEAKRIEEARRREEEQKKAVPAKVATPAKADAIAMKKAKKKAKKDALSQGAKATYLPPSAPPRKASAGY